MHQTYIYFAFSKFLKTKTTDMKQNANQTTTVCVCVYYVIPLLFLMVCFVGYLLAPACYWILKYCPSHFNICFEIDSCGSFFLIFKGSWLSQCWHYRIYSWYFFWIILFHGDEYLSSGASIALLPLYFLWVQHK